MFWYLASPYSHPDPLVRTMRAGEARLFTGALLAQGHYVFSPIHHCHQLSRDRQMPTDFLFWWGYNEAFIRPSTGMIVAQIDGWTESKGVTAEIEFARQLTKPIQYARLRADGFCELQGNIPW